MPTKPKARKKAASTAVIRRTRGRPRNRAPTCEEELTSKQKTVATWSALMIPNKVIAERLNIAKGTVVKYLDYLEVQKYRNKLLMSDSETLADPLWIEAATYLVELLHKRTSKTLTPALKVKAAAALLTELRNLNRGEIKLARMRHQHSIEIEKMRAETKIAVARVQAERFDDDDDDDEMSLEDFIPATH